MGQPCSKTGGLLLPGVCPEVVINNGSIDIKRCHSNLNDDVGFKEITIIKKQRARWAFKLCGFHFFGCFLVINLSIGFLCLSLFDAPTHR